MSYGYKAILAIEGEDEIMLDNCSYTYLRDVNEKTGEVQSPVLNGTITLMFIDYPKDEIREWAMGYKFKNGSIKVQQTDENKGSYIPVEEVKLTQAACVHLHMSYHRPGYSHFCTTLIITSNVSVVGDTYDWVNKNWLLPKNYNTMDKNTSKQEVKSEVEELLPLNDTSVDARMYLNDEEYAIDAFDIEFQQSFDFKGEPQMEVKGGLLSITMSRVADEQLNYWMFHNKVSFSGAIVFASFSRIANPVITISFTNARCARYSKEIGHSSISLTLLITAEEISINGIKHRNKRKKMF